MYRQQVLWRCLTGTLNLSGSAMVQQLPCIRGEYTSCINLKNLYPNSSLRLTTPTTPQVTEHTNEKFSGYIPMDKLKFTFSRSPGPGGQHANTTNSKVEVRFHIPSAGWLHPDIKERLLAEKSQYITKEGDFLMRSDKTRSQHMNIADVMRRIRIIIYKLASSPPEPNPETEERIRKRKEKANRERLMEKRWQSLIKGKRSRLNEDEVL